jgi:hypothetical protein
MTAATAVPPDVAAYLAAVRASLNDLPEAERDDLVSEVEASLADAAAEGGSLTARLGPPEAFATELRTAAGLHPTPPVPRGEDALVRRIRELVSHPRLVQTRALARELAPIWWVARGYLAVGALALVLKAEWSTRLPIVPRVGDSATWGVVTIVLAAIASVAVGRWLRTHGTRFSNLVLVANVALALSAIPVAQRALDSVPLTVVSPTPAEATYVPGIVSNGVPVNNVYPFTRDGELLHDVLLYDGAGRPLEIRGDRFTDPDRRIVVTNGNTPLFNVFPIRYFEPGTKRVARPNAVPFIEHPIVLTPRLQR